MMAVFVKGLDERIRVELILHPQESLQVVVEKAEQIEARNNALAYLDSDVKLGPSA